MSKRNRRTRKPTVFEQFQIEPWMAAGLCSKPTENPDDWFPHKTRAEYARSICGTCSVKEDCLNYAITWPGETQLLGIWGGTDEKQRRPIIMRMRMKKEVA